MVNPERELLLRQANQYNAGIAPRSTPKGNWLTNLLPAAGGVAGGALGLLAGPGGAIAGGAGGSALGEWLRQSLSGEDTSLGKIGTEAALGGIPLGIGRGLKLAKTAKTGLDVASDGARLGGRTSGRAPLKSLTSYEGAPDRSRVDFYKQQLQSGKEVEPLSVMKDSKGAFGIEDGKHRYQAMTELGMKDAPVSFKGPGSLDDIYGAPATAAPTKPGVRDLLAPGDDGLLARAGRGVRAGARGTKASDKIGSGRYGTELSDETNEYVSRNILKDRKIQTPNRMYVSGDKHLSELGKQYRSTAEAKSALPQNVRTDALKSIDNAVVGNAELVAMSKPDKAFLGEIRRRVAEARTGEDYIKVLSDIGRKTSDKAIGGDAVAMRQELRNTLRQALKDVRMQNMPETSRIAREMHLTSNFLESVGRKADALGNNMGGPAAKALSLASSALETPGRAIENIGRAAASPIGRIIGRETVPRMGFAALNPQGGQPTAPMDAQAPTGLDDLYGAPGAGADTGMDMGMGGEPQQPQSQYPQQNFIQDVMRDMQATGGKNVANLKMIYEMINPEPTKDSVNRQKAEFATRGALSVLDQLKENYGEAGGGQGRIPGFIASVAGKAGLNDDVNVYDDQRAAFLAKISRSLGEVGVLTDKDIERIEKALPSISSNPREAEKKWRSIEGILAEGLNAANQSFTSAPTQYDLQSLMSQ